MSARKLVALPVALLSLVVAATPAQAKRERDRPSRVIILVLDQARPDTITRYGMENVQRLQREGMTFPNAIVGHMAAETVISHNVLTSGLFPKHMGWTDEVYRDTEGVVTPADDYHITSSMSCAQYDQMIEHGGYRKLQDYLDQRFGETSMFASISQKRSSACPGGHVSGADGSPDDPEDLILQIRGDRHPECGNREWRKPEDGNQPVPGTASAAVTDLFPELLDIECDRWSTDQAPGGYGTGSISPANLYPLDTNRFVPGFDEAHLGGDVWSTDAAINVIKKTSSWRGMMISLGGIDKLGHMWGPEDTGVEDGVDVDDTPGSVEEMRHLPFIAKTADDQVGRLVEALEDEDVLRETLLVITADHAAQTGTDGEGEDDHFHGELAPGQTNPRCDAPSTGIRSDCNWYFGRDLDEIYEDPADPVAVLRDRLNGNLAMSYQDGHVAAWLHDDSDAKKREAALAVLDMPDVIASFRINEAHDDYRLHGMNPLTGRERAWFARHGEELVDTMAHPSSPEVVGLLRTNATYGVTGDHGGHNRLIQSIPMVLYGPGVGSKDSNREIRHVDVVPTVLELMGISYDEDDFDGEAVKVSRPKG